MQKNMHWKSFAVSVGPCCTNTMFRWRTVATTSAVGGTRRIRAVRVETCLQATTPSPRLCRCAPKAFAPGSVTLPSPWQRVSECCTPDGLADWAGATKQLADSRIRRCSYRWRQRFALRSSFRMMPSVPCKSVLRLFWRPRQVNMPCELEMMQMHARLIWMKEQEAMHADDSAAVLSLSRHLHGPKVDCA